MNKLKRAVAPLIVAAAIYGICVFAGVNHWAAFFIGIGVAAYIYLQNDLENLSARVEHLERETLNLGPMPDD